MSERNAASPRRRDVDMPCAASGLWMSSAAPSTALATSFDAYTTTTWWQPPFEAASIACLTIGWPSKSRSSFSVPPMRELEPAASTTAPTGSSDAARRSLEGRAARIHSTSAAAAVAALAKSCRRALSASTAITFRPASADRSGMASGTPTTASVAQSGRDATCCSAGTTSRPRTTTLCGPSGSRYVRPRMGTSRSLITKTGTHPACHGAQVVLT